MSPFGRVSELAAGYAKGWFRKGMALLPMKRYDEAIHALTQAGQLDPKNSQILHAIKRPWTGGGLS